MMSEVRNTQVVKDAYAAFLRGDVNAILSSLDEAVEWEAVKGTEGVAPHAGLRRGRAAIAEFFKQVNDGVVFETFEPREFVAQGDMVVVIGRYRGTVKSTSRPFSADWVMAFRIRDEKVVQFREWTDSAQLVRAFAHEAAAVSASSSVGQA